MFASLLYSKAIICFILLLGYVGGSDPRLPTEVTPFKYDLHITTQIHRDILTYSGNVSIDLNINQKTESITLHSKDLQLEEVFLINLQNKKQIDDIDFKVDGDILKIFSKKKHLKLEPEEQYCLKINFIGNIQSKTKGIFRSAYTDDQNNTIPSLATYFEPSTARSAFPCFDEPSFKGKFKISITHGSNYSAISNMPAADKPILSGNGEMTTTSFQETPAMSTYLIAFVVSNFRYFSQTADGIKHGVFLPPNSHDLSFSILRNSMKSVAALSHYLEMPYSLPKLDHIFLKADDTFIAMDNWGLIIYNYEKFLPLNDKAEILNQIILQNQEISHQWFGNFITPKWWKYFWLSKGMATYFSYITTDLVLPNDKIMEYFIPNELFDLSIHGISRPVTYDIPNENEMKKFEVRNLYKHGASIIKMFHHAIGDKTFVKGVKKYLNKHKYSVADEDDFFAALQEAVNEDNILMFKNNDHSIGDVMRTWTHNQGFPSLEVIRNYEDGTITIKQKSTRRGLDQYWWIPINFATASNPYFEKTSTDYIIPPQSEITINLKDIGIQLLKSDWLIVNKQMTGFYFVKYDNQNLKLIAEALNSDKSKIHQNNRAQFYRDVAPLFLKQSDYIDVNTQFLILKSLKNEKESLPWHFASHFLVTDVDRRLKRTQVNETFNAFVRDIVDGIFEKLFYSPIKELSATDYFMREKIHKLACKAEHEKCIEYTKKLTFDYFLNGVEIGDINSEDALCYGIKNTNFGDFKKMVDAVFKHKTDVDKYFLFIASLQCLESEEMTNYFYKVLAEQEFSMDKEAYENLKEIPLRAFIIEYLNNKFYKKTANMLRKIVEEMGNHPIVHEYYSKDNEDQLFALLKNFLRKENVNNKSL